MLLIFLRPVRFSFLFFLVGFFDLIRFLKEYDFFFFLHFCVAINIAIQKFGVSTFFSFFSKKLIILLRRDVLN